MAQKQDQLRASRAVKTWLAHHERNTAWLVRQTEADAGTIGDFLNGKRWPKYRTQGRIEKAIGWPAGKLTDIADGGEVPTLEVAGLEVAPDPTPSPITALTNEELVAEVLRRMRGEADVDVSTGLSPRHQELADRTREAVAKRVPKGSEVPPRAAEDTA